MAETLQVRFSSMIIFYFSLNYILWKMVNNSVLKSYIVYVTDVVSLRQIGGYFRFTERNYSECQINQV